LACTFLSRSRVVWLLSSRVCRSLACSRCSR